LVECLKKKKIHPLMGNEPLLFRGVARNFVRGVSTNSVEDRENGDLGAAAP